MSPPILWHYTHGFRLRGILRDGMIKLATEGAPADGKFAVWFSSNQQWEESANQRTNNYHGTPGRGTKETTHHFGGGLARVGVRPETAPHDWNAFKELSGVPARLAKGMHLAGIGAGADPGEWFASFEAVPREKWVAVERWDGKRWMALEDVQGAPLE